MNDFGPLIAEDLVRIRSRAAAASAGPWMRNGKTSHGWRIDDADPNRLGMVFLMTPTAIVPSDENAEFIAHAREDVPRLLEEILRLRAEAARMEIEQGQLKLAAGSANATADRYGAMLDEAMVSLAGAGIHTPEKGFRPELVVSLAWHIDLLAKERDDARRQLLTVELSAEKPAAPASSEKGPYPIDESGNPETRV